MRHKVSARHSSREPEPGQANAILPRSMPRFVRTTEVALPTTRKWASEPIRLPNKYLFGTGRRWTASSSAIACDKCPCPTPLVQLVSRREIQGCVKARFAILKSMSTGQPARDDHDRRGYGHLASAAVFADAA